MKYLITISLITVLSACGETKNTITDSVEPENTTKQITLNSLIASDYTLQINQTALLEMPEYGSVGITSEVIIQDETILTLVSDEFVYTNEPKEGTTGGDSGTRSYIFKALKTGQTSINAKDIFRGELQNEIVFNITIQ